jgi:hypothetical protein
MSDSDKVTGVALGMGGLFYVKEALEEVKSAGSIEQKVDRLTHTVELVIAHLQHLESQAERAEMESAFR